MVKFCNFNSGKIIFALLTKVIIIYMELIIIDIKKFDLKRLFF